MSFKTRRLSEERTSRFKISSATPLVMKTGRGLLGWYARWKQRKKEDAIAEKQGKFLRRAGLTVAAVALILLLLAGTVKALVGLQILTPHNILNVAGAELPVDKDGFTNFLLLGSGDKSHDGVNLTDTIMIASIDPVTKSVALLSLPRDLFVTRTAKMGRGRINVLYRDYKGYLQYNGMEWNEASQESLRELGSELGRQMGVELHGVIKVDFIAFVRAVDALGGIDVEVPHDIVDTQYPGPNYSYQTFTILSGPQHLDGETALKYARSRHTTSDFDRSGRQQQILRALAEKARAQGITASPGKITSLFRILSENVETTLPLRELLGVAKLAERIDKQNVISIHLNDEPAQPGGFLYSPPRDQFDGASVLLPEPVGDERAGSWRQLRSLTYVLLHSRAIELSRPQIYVLNAGAPAGAARLLAGELTRYGFPVSEINNLAESGKDRSLDRDVSVIIPKVEIDASIADYFAGLLEMHTSPPPVDVPIDKLGQITIIVGKDYVYKPIQELVPSEALDAPTGSLPSTPSSASMSSMSSASPALRSSVRSEAGSASSSFVSLAPRSSAHSSEVGSDSSASFASPAPRSSARSEVGSSSSS